MAKKNFDNLVNNMIGTSAPVQTPAAVPAQAEEAAVPESKPVRRGRPAKSEEATENFCGRADSLKLAKIRAVAERENIPIKDIYNLAFDMFINAYEAKHEVIVVKSKQDRGDVNSLI